MKVSDHIQQAKKTLLSFEILPPIKGNGIESIYRHLDPLIQFNPSFINVTYHRREKVDTILSDGNIQSIETRKRPGTVGICAAIQYRYKIDTVMHLICGGFNKDETEDALIDLSYLGIENVLVLRGDALKKDKHVFIPEVNGHRYAIDLLHQVKDMNEGRLLNGGLDKAHPTQFSIGVAGYPEKHFQATSLDADLDCLKAKVDAGAEYIITQMFFNNQHYFDFVNRCRDKGIHIPIIPGLKPLTRKKQIDIISNVFFVEIPPDLKKSLSATETDEAAEQVGTEWLVQQSLELKKAGAPVLHYYTLGAAKVTGKVLEKVF